MAQKDDFNYYLRTDTGAGYEYYTVISGAVSLTATKTAIVYAPEGWQEKSLRWSRDWQKAGIFSSYTVPMKFVNDGGKILKHIFFTLGINSSIEFYIEKLDRGTMLYSDYFIGNVDLTTIEDTRDFVTVTISGSQYLDQLKSRSSTNYEIELDNNANAFYVYMDGIDLKCTIPFKTILEPVDGVGAALPKTINFGSLLGGTEIEPSLILLPIEGYSNGDIFGKQVQVNFSILSYFFPPGFPTNPKEVSLSHAQDYFVKNKSTSLDYDLDLELDFDVDWTIDGSASQNGRLEVLIVTAVGTPALPAKISNTTTIFTSSYIAPGASTTTSVTASATINVPATEALWMVFRIAPIGAPVMGDFGTANFVDGGDMYVRYVNRVPASYVKVLRPAQVFSELVDQMSEGEVTTNAPILTTNENIVVTCGDGLRGLSDSLIKTNFNDFFRSFDARLFIGTDYDESTKIQNIYPKEYYFDGATLIGDFGEVSNVDIRFLTEEIFSGIDGGYNDYNYDEINGTDEFNTQFEWLSPITKTDSSLDIKSTYRADMFGIEFTRANLVGKNTTDSSSDNDIFLLRIEDTPAGVYNGLNYYNLYRDGALTVIGLLSPDTAFNIQLSPKRGLLANGAFISSMLYLMGSEYINFQASTKNQGLDTTDGVTAIEENADILISDLDAAYFYPILLEFDFLPNRDLSNIMASNPYGYFTLTLNGNQYEVFLIDIQEDPATNAATRAKAILTINNTLSNLI